MKTEFIKDANLPKNKVQYALIGKKYSETADELSKLGIETICLDENKNLDNETASHADMLCCYLGNGEIVLSNEQLNAYEKLKGIGTDIKMQKGISAPYPHDIALNAAFFGNKIICNKKFISNHILNYAEKNSLTVINTHQGYSKCSICIVRENAVITEDEGIISLLKNYQIDVLKIKPDQIYLSDKHYGFLGGSSFKISDDQIYFNGNIEAHANYKEIINFLIEQNVKPVYNINRPLTDIGGILPITQITTD